MKRIVIKTVPKSQIRNNGVGDYAKTKGGLEIRVADMGDKKAEAEVAIHEFVEAMLVTKRKIPFSKINAFDKKYKDIDKEPGEMKNAPYKKEHSVANRIEKILAKELSKK